MHLAMLCRVHRNGGFREQEEATIITTSFWRKPVQQTCPRLLVQYIANLNDLVNKDRVVKRPYL